MGSVSRSRPGTCAVGPPGSATRPRAASHIQAHQPHAPRSGTMWARMPGRTTSTHIQAHLTPPVPAHDGICFAIRLLLGGGLRRKPPRVSRDFHPVEGLHHLCCRRSHPPRSLSFHPLQGAHRRIPISLYIPISNPLSNPLSNSFLAPILLLTPYFTPISSLSHSYPTPI